MREQQSEPDQKEKEKKRRDKLKRKNWYGKNSLVNLKSFNKEKKPSYEVDELYVFSW